MDCDYFTDAIDYTQVKVLEEFEMRGCVGRGSALHGDVRVNRQIVGFKKIKFYTHGERRRGQSLDARAGDAHDGVLAAFPGGVSGAFRRFIADGAAERHHGLGNALRTVASLLLMCDPRDLGVALTEKVAPEDGVFEPNLYLIRHLSGRNRAERSLFRLSPKLFATTLNVNRTMLVRSRLSELCGSHWEVGEKGKEAAARFLNDIM